MVPHQLRHFPFILNLHGPVEEESHYQVKKKSRHTHITLFCDYDVMVLPVKSFGEIHQEGKDSYLLIIVLLVKDLVMAERVSLGPTILSKVHFITNEFQQPHNNELKKAVSAIGRRSSSLNGNGIFASV